MSTSLTYRTYTERDIPGLIRLWEQNSNWGSLTPELWKQWYVDTPHGPCIVAVATNPEGEIVAQEVFTPSVVSVNGTAFRALRLSAPILRKDLRTGTIRSRHHPVVGLYDIAIEEAIRRGYRIVYALPEHAWLPFLKWLGEFSYVQLRCVAAPVRFPQAGEGADMGDLLAQPAAVFGREYDDLWSIAQTSFPIACGVVRHAEWLRYKNGGHVTIEVRSKGDGKLIGYCAARKTSGLVVDLLARTQKDVERVLQAVMGFLAGPTRRELPDAIRQLQVMEIPFLAPALHALGFKPIDYMFAFICRGLGPEVAAADIVPERWYILPGD